jgi:DNA mismatch endonuclease (patch repair protein)
MADTLGPEDRSARMALIKSKDTKPEMVVRRLVSSLGSRYRLHAADLPGKPDLVFRGKRKVIFVHGCFWHRHSAVTCKLARLPKSRLEFWEQKLESNRRRDARNRRALREGGWSVLQIWECELGNMTRLQRRVEAFLR